MIKYYSIIIKIRTFIDSFTDLFKTRILCSVTYFCSWYVRYKMRNTLYRQTGERQYYTRNASHGFTVLDNHVYRHNLKKNILFIPECICV